MLQPNKGNSQPITQLCTCALLFVGLAPQDRFASSFNYSHPYYPQSISSTQLQANSSNAFQSNMSNFLPTSKCVPWSALRAQASVLPQSSNMIFNTSSVPAAALQDFLLHLMYKCQHHFQLMLINCSPIPHYIVEINLLILLNNLDKFCPLKFIWPALFVLKCRQSRTLEIGVMILLSSWGFCQKSAGKSCSINCLLFAYF